MIGCHSCVFSDLDCRIASPMPGRFGCSGRNSRRPALSGHCSSASMQRFDRLALWGLRHYAPIVATDPPDGLVIDTTGAAHLHGGEDAMLNGVVDQLAASGVAARAAIADSW